MKGGIEMSEIIKEFEKLLEDKSKNENDIQIFLEDNSELIPLPFLATHQLHQSAVISKLPLGNEFITDFAYLTKCSDYWNLVLIEIEDPKKNIFTKSTENVTFTSKFNHAYEQVQSWKAYVEYGTHKMELKNRVEKLMGIGSITEIPFYVKYVLIYGRRSEKNSNKRICAFNTKNNDDILVKTYDSLISEYTSKPKIPKMILSAWKEQGFCIKKVPMNLINMTLLTYLNSDYIKIDPNARKQLIAQGYCIDQWESGEYLTEFDKMDELSAYNNLKRGFKKDWLKIKLEKEGKL